MRQHWFVRYTPSILVGAASAAPVAAAPPAMAPSAPPSALPPSTLSPSSLPPVMQYSVDMVRESTRLSAEDIFGSASAPSAPAPPADPPTPAPAAGAAPPVAPEPAAAPQLGLLLGSVLGLDVAADSVREARQIVFGDSSVPASLAAHGGGAPASSVPENADASPVPVQHSWSAAFSANKIKIDGVEYGHIQIKTFYFSDADGFVAEFVRLLRNMPGEGLILDVRGNGGGNILAAERLLQTLTAVPIEPERLQFIVSAGTLELCRNNERNSGVPLGQWVGSLEGGVETGSIYSHAFSLTDLKSCNALGQCYYGPVVLVVDGNCYSATDIFAAGFQDHGIGQVLGVAEATGAGGANVWDHALLSSLLPVGWGLKPLPGQAGMRVAIRQCLRVGPQAGSLLEDFGVVPNEVALPTLKDVLQGDVDLMTRAAALLQSKSSHGLKLHSHKVSPTGKETIKLKTHNLKRIDVYLNDRPLYSDESQTVRSLWSFSLPKGRKPNSVLRVVGFADPGAPTPAALLQTPVP